MKKKYWLIILIIILLVAGFLYLYLNCQLKKTIPSTEAEKSENAQSIQLEKPPFIKD